MVDKYRGHNILRRIPHGDSEVLVLTKPTADIPEPPTADIPLILTTQEDGSRSWEENTLSQVIASTSTTVDQKLASIDSKIEALENQAQQELQIIPGESIIIKVGDGTEKPNRHPWEPPSAGKWFISFSCTGWKANTLRMDVTLTIFDENDTSLGTLRINRYVNEKNSHKFIGIGHISVDLPKKPLTFYIGFPVDSNQRMDANDQFWIWASKHTEVLTPTPYNSPSALPTVAPTPTTSVEVGSKAIEFVTALPDINIAKTDRFYAINGIDDGLALHYKYTDSWTQIYPASLANTIAYTSTSVDTELANLKAQISALESQVQNPFNVIPGESIVIATGSGVEAGTPPPVIDSWTPPSAGKWFISFSSSGWKLNSTQRTDTILKINSGETTLGTIRINRYMGEHNSHKFIGIGHTSLDLPESLIDFSIEYATDGNQRINTNDQYWIWATKHTQITSNPYTPPTIQPSVTVTPSTAVELGGTAIEVVTALPDVATAKTDRLYSVNGQSLHFKDADSWNQIFPTGVEDAIAYTSTSVDQELSTLKAKVAALETHSQSLNIVDGTSEVLFAETGESINWINQQNILIKEWTPPSAGKWSILFFTPTGWITEPRIYFPALIIDDNGTEITRIEAKRFPEAANRRQMCIPGIAVVELDSKPYNLYLYNHTNNFGARDFITAIAFKQTEVTLTPYTPPTTLPPVTVTPSTSVELGGTAIEIVTELPAAPKNNRFYAIQGQSLHYRDGDSWVQVYPFADHESRIEALESELATIKAAYLSFLRGNERPIDLEQNQIGIVENAVDTDHNGLYYLSDGNLVQI